MSTRLVNVRLDTERLRKVRALRARGVALSDVVREAIDDTFEALDAAPPLDARAAVEQVFARYPDPRGLPERPYDVHDRRAARRAIARKLKVADR